MDAVYEGEEGIRRWWREFHEPWRRIEVIPERVVERGDEVAILLRFEGTGRDGIATSMSFINTITIKDGLAWRFGALRPSDEALRKLGLE
jgi:ketosteroid isomerase-like protein